MECYVGIMQATYFGLGIKDHYGSYSCVVAPIDDSSSWDNHDDIPARMLDVRTGDVVSTVVHADQLQQPLTQQEISFLKLRCIIRILASPVGDIKKIEQMEPVINM